MSVAKLESGESLRSSTVSFQEITNTVRDFVALTKPRIMLLLLFTGYCAMVVAQGGFPKIGVTIAAMVGLGLSTGGAAALNMWYDRDIDAVMNRTKQRPIPSGRVKASHALVYGIALQVLSMALLGFAVNWLTSILGLVGFLYYVVFYTMWLKRRTPQNIVIGGGAGAFPPIIGWSAVTGHLGLPAILMFLIIFLWTPPHFWSLALYKHDDYKRAHIPMMPVVRGERTTKIQSLIYTILLFASAVSLYFTHTVGLVYLVVSILLSGAFIVYAVLALLEKETHFMWSKRTFKFSLLYLSVLFVVMVINVHH